MEAAKISHPLAVTFTTCRLLIH